MPVFFYIDPEFVNDFNCRNVRSITLSYSFFRAQYDKNGVLTSAPGALMTG